MEAPDRRDQRDLRRIQERQDPQDLVVVEEGVDLVRGSEASFLPCLSLRIQASMIRF